MQTVRCAGASATNRRGGHSAAEVQVFSDRTPLNVRSHALRSGAIDPLQATAQQISRLESCRSKEAGEARLRAPTRWRGQTALAIGPVAER
jgi:hypothetical protein